MRGAEAQTVRDNLTRAALAVAAIERDPEHVGELAKAAYSALRAALEIVDSEQQAEQRRARSPGKPQARRRRDDDAA